MRLTKRFAIIVLLLILITACCIACSNDSNKKDPTPTWPAEMSLEEMQAVIAQGNYTMEWTNTEDAKNGNFVSTLYACDGKMKLYSTNGEFEATTYLYKKGEVYYLIDNENRASCYTVILESLTNVWWAGEEYQPYEYFSKGLETDANGKISIKDSYNNTYYNGDSMTYKYEYKEGKYYVIGDCSISHQEYVLKDIGTTAAIDIPDTVYAKEDSAVLYTTYVIKNDVSYHLDEDLTFHVSDKNYGSTYVGNAKKIEIMSEIDGVSVTGIDGVPNYVYSVTIPDSIVYIKEDAFKDCKNLLEVYNLSTLNIVKGSTTFGYVAYYAEDVYTTKKSESKISIANDGSVFYTNVDKKILLDYQGDGEFLYIPNDVTEIRYDSTGDYFAAIEIAIDDPTNLIDYYEAYGADAIWDLPMYKIILSSYGGVLYFDSLITIENYFLLLSFIGESIYVKDGIGFENALASLVQEHNESEDNGDIITVTADSTTTFNGNTYTKYNFQSTKKHN